MAPQGIIAYMRIRPAGRALRKSYDLTTLCTHFPPAPVPCYSQFTLSIPLDPSIWMNVIKL